MKTIQNKKKRPEFHGVLLVDKPTGFSSHDVVSKVRRLLHTKEVGHTGTLDPLASGLMAVLVGEATKVSQYVTDGDKTYVVELMLGIETDTLDQTGQILKKSDVNVTDEQVRTMALSLQGEFDLPIPLYSAKKIDGLKLYEYARQNIEIECPHKTMKFWGLRALPRAYTDAGSGEFAFGQRYTFEISCSKGSFIRSWVDYLGRRLGCGAVMTALRRTVSHRFRIEQALSLKDYLDSEGLVISSLTESQNQKIKQSQMSLSEALADIKKVRVKDHDEVLLRNGQISHDLRSKLIMAFDPSLDEYIQVVSRSSGEERILALIGVEVASGLRIRRVFKYDSP